MNNSGTERWDKGYMPLAGDESVERHLNIIDELKLDLKIAVDGSARLKDTSAEEICRSLQHEHNRRDQTRMKIYGAASAVWCHELYFKHLVTGDKYPSLPQGETAKLLKQSFGSPGNFFYIVRTMAQNISSPGFLWLYRKIRGRAVGKLGLICLPSYNVPDLREVCPLWCIDLWEHAYIDRWGTDISGYADGCLRQADWEAIMR